MTEQQIKSCLTSIVVTLFILAIAFILILAAPSKLGISVPVIKNPPRTDLVPIVVAARDIPRGQTITGELIKTREFPKDFLPLGAITQPEDAIGRTVAIPLTKGDAVLDLKLAPKGAGRALAP
jgi:Flp pilus assembly protein CpaB